MLRRIKDNRPKSCLLWQITSTCTGWREPVVQSGGWVTLLGGLAKTLCRNSRHAFRKHPHCSHPLRRGSTPFFWTHLTSGCSANKMPTGAETSCLPFLVFPDRAETPRFFCGSTFNFHPTWRCTSFTWFTGGGWTITLQAHTPPQKSAESNYPASLVSCRQLATITVILHRLTSSVRRTR